MTHECAWLVEAGYGAGTEARHDHFLYQDDACQYPEHAVGERRCSFRQSMLSVGAEIPTLLRRRMTLRSIWATARTTT